MKFKKGYYLICTKSVTINGEDDGVGYRFYTKGKSYEIVGDNGHYGDIFLIDDHGTKRPISTNPKSCNLIRVYWKNNFSSRDYSIAQILGE